MSPVLGVYCAQRSPAFPCRDASGLQAASSQPGVSARPRARVSGPDGEEAAKTLFSLRPHHPDAAPLAPFPRDHKPGHFQARVRV